MPKSINLLPAEFGQKGKLVKLASLVTRTAGLGFGVFIITSVGLVSLFILDLVTLKSSLGRQELLKASIGKLSTTEQKFVLVRDRIEKAKAIIGKEEALKGAERLATFSPDFSGEMTLVDAEILSQKTKFAVLTGNSAVLAEFVKRLVSSNFYQKIDLASFSFNPGSGYLVSFETQIK